MTPTEIRELKKVRAIIDNLLGKEATIDIYPVHVTHSLPSYKELQKDFDWVSSYFEDVKWEKEPKRKDGEVIFELLHLNRDFTMDEALKYIKERGYEPATFVELLAFAKAYPDKQREFLIIAFGSVAVVGRGRDVAYVNESDGERNLGLGVAGFDWRGPCRLLVRKSP